MQVDINTASNYPKVSSPSTRNGSSTAAVMTFALVRTMEMVSKAELTIISFFTDHRKVSQALPLSDWVQDSFHDILINDGLEGAFAGSIQMSLAFDSQWHPQVRTDWKSTTTLKGESVLIIAKICPALMLILVPTFACASQSSKTNDTPSNKADDKNMNKLVSFPPHVSFEVECKTRLNLVLNFLTWIILVSVTCNKHVAHLGQRHQGLHCAFWIVTTFQWCPRQMHIVPKASHTGNIPMDLREMDPYGSPFQIT